MDIQEIANSLTCNEFISEYCYMLCPHAFGLNDISKDKLKCSNIECDDCWKKSLSNIKFKEEI